MIEMLVVVSIIAILVALLLPSLKQAKDMARATVCVSQQRQFMIAFRGYVDDYAGWWVNAGSDDNLGWYRIVAFRLGQRYVYEQPTQGDPVRINYGGSTQRRDLTARNRGNGVMKCPTESALGYTNLWGGENATSYRFNTAFGGGASGYGLGVSDAAVFSSDAYRRVRDTEVRKPANTIITADGIYKDKQFEYEQGNLGGPNHVATYHFEGANLLWVDGHATHLKVHEVKLEHFDRRL